MKDLFMCLLLNLMKHGDITTAAMYKGGTFSSIVVETADGVYSVSISKEDKTDEK